MYKHILVPSDGSAISMKAAKTAIRFANSMGARITAVHILAPYVYQVYGDAMGYAPISDPKAYKLDSENYARKILGKVEAVARRAGVVCRGVSVSSPQVWEGILKVAKAQSCDAIVMASHGYRGVKGLLLGSETTKVLTHSKLPVLVVR